MSELGASRYESDGLLSALRTTELTQVWFVRDYLGLIFEDDQRSWSWQCYVWPSLTVGGRLLRLGEPGYRDALCAFIDQAVSLTEESIEAGLTVHFGGGHIALRPTVKELAGPEIASLHVLFEQGSWAVWRPGEHIFRNLI